MSQTLTVAQRGLLLAMYQAGPRRVHHVAWLGYNLPPMLNLKRKGLAETTDHCHGGLWKGRLTAAGRRRARELVREIVEVRQ